MTCPRRHRAAGPVALLVAALAFGACADDDRPGPTATSPTVTVDPATNAMIEELCGSRRTGTASRSDLVIRLEPNAPASSIAALHSDLESDPRVRSVVLVDAATVWSELNEQLADLPDRLEGVSQSSIGPLLRAEVGDAQDLGAATRTYEEREYVHSVSTNRVEVQCDAERALRHAADWCADQPDLIVYGTPEMTYAEQRAIDAAIDRATDDVEYLDSQEVYEEFVELFEDRPKVVEAVTAADLPPSWRVRLPDDEVIDDVVEELEQLPSVSNVVRTDATCNEPRG